MEASSQPVLSPPQLVEYLSTAPGRCIIVDNTSDQTIADAYPLFLRNGISVVTPNKKAFSGSLALWNAIRAAAAIAHSPTNPSSGDAGLLYHEGTVGAGLPVVSTLKDLVATGDQVTRIEGVFSGTMSFLFNRFAPLAGRGGTWSAEVAHARHLGVTEPDPRDDLNGRDVARKLVILARLAGLEVDGTHAVQVQSLIPKQLEGVDGVDAFMRQLPAFDAAMEAIKTEAEDEGRVVRFVGSVDVVKQELRVGVERFDRGHPIAALKAGDQLVSFHTRRYGDRPLVIQGPSASGELTAMGVISDLIKVVQRL